MCRVEEMGKRKVIPVVGGANWKQVSRVNNRRLSLACEERNGDEEMIELLFEVSIVNENGTVQLAPIRDDRNGLLFALA